jgi:hypothetical protein
MFIPALAGAWACSAHNLALLSATMLLILQVCVVLGAALAELER